MKSRMPRCVFFPPNQSRLLSRLASGMLVIALLAWAKESLSVAMTLALSLVDFSRPLQVNASRRRRPHEFVQVVVRCANVQEDLGERANLGCGTPIELVGGNRFGEAGEFIFLNGDFGQHFRAVSGNARSAIFIRIGLGCNLNCTSHEKEQTEGGENLLHREVLL